MHDPIRDGALNLTGNPGERDRQITLACQKLVTLLPQPPVVIKSESPARMAKAAPAGHLPAAATLGQLNRVPDLPPGYVHRNELIELAAAITSAEHRAVGITGRSRSLGLHGQGGIGKSVLAAAVAREEIVRNRFRDGIFWVSFGESGNILTAQLDLLRRLDSSLPAPRTPSDAEQILRKILAERQVLLVVDDVWSDGAAHAFRLTGPEGQVLYTTRDSEVLEARSARRLCVSNSRLLARLQRPYCGPTMRPRVRIFLPWGRSRKPQTWRLNRSDE